MTGNEIQNKIRRQLRHEQGRFDHLRVIEEINAGLYDFTAETLALTKVKTYSVTKFKRDFDFPNDFLDVRNIYYNLKPLVWRSQQEMKDLFLRQGEMAKKGTPTLAYQQIHGSFSIHPLPDSDRATGAIASAISFTRTSFTMLAAGTSGFSDIGFFAVSDAGEVVAYFTLATNEFGAAVRGHEETSAETIASGTTLFERDLRMDYYALDLGLTADTMDSSPQISKEYHNCIIDYALWQLFDELPNGEQLATKHERAYLRVRQEAKSNIKKQQRSRLLTVRDTEFGAWQL